MVRIIINNIKVKLTGDISILNKLYEYLSFKHPNSFFMMKKVKYSWDGMVHPLNKNGIMSTGLLPKAWEFMAQFTDDYEVVDNRDIPEYETIPTTVGKLELRPYQVEAIRAVVTNNIYGIPWPRGFVFAGMAAGKTAIMFGLHIAYGYKKTLILVDNSKLFDQIKEDLYNTFNDYGYMRGTQVKWGAIMVCMVQTLHNRLVDYHIELNDFEILLVDEADLAANDTYNSVFKDLSHISVKVGFSGTIFLRESKKDMVRNTTLRSSFGEIISSITSKELEDQGFTTKAIIKLLPGLTPKKKFLTFNEEFVGLLEEDPDRLELLLKRVEYNLRTKKHPIMVFTRFISQTETVYKFLRRKLPKKYRIAYLHHKVTDNTILQRFKLGNTHILVCSLFLKRGINLPLVKVIINNSAGEFYSNPLQIMGRGVRLSNTKTKFYFEDFMDGGKYLERHSKQRVSHYKKQGHKIIDLRG